MLEIGVIGAGFMASTHVDRYGDIDGASVSAVASPNNAEAFVADRDLESRAFADAHRMMDEMALDAVDICTPTPTHRDLIESAASRRLDVFCEKPLTHRVEDLGTIRDVIDRSGISCMVGHVVRFFPEYETIKHQIDDGLIGDVGTVRARRHIPPPDWATWYHDESQSGGVLVDLAVHDFDYLRWLVGDVERVFARSTGWGDSQHAQVMLRFETGVIGYIEASSALPADQALTTELEVAGTNGLIDFGNADVESLHIARSVGGDGDLGNIPPNPLAEDGFHRELEAFVNSLETDSMPPIPLEDAIEAVRVALAAKQSVESGAPIRPQEVGP